MINKISKLQRVIELVDKEETQVSRLPNNQEMFDKINEIVEGFNQLVEHKSKTEPNPFAPKSSERIYDWE